MATYLVTGANRGIGYEYCRQLQSRGDRAIAQARTQGFAVCRETTADLEALGIRIEENIDITSDASVANLHERLKETQIDVLINNAAIAYGSARSAIAKSVALQHLDFDSIREQFEVNALGALRVTQVLLPRLKAGGKVVMMTSRMGLIADNTSGSSYGYRMSKVALSMAGKSLSHDLKPRGIAVAILHPGLVQTRMTNFTANGITPEVSVGGLLARIDELTLENTGTFWHSNGEVLPW